MSAIYGRSNSVISTSQSPVKPFSPKLSRVTLPCATQLIPYDLFSERVRRSLFLENPSEDKIPKWQKLYQAAVLGTEPALLKKRAIEAETAVLLRMEELKGSADHHDEREKLARVVTALQILRNSDWAV